MVHADTEYTIEEQGVKRTIPLKANKIRYKKDVEVPLHIAKELRECAEEAALLDYRMENIQKNLGTYLKPDTQTPEQR